MGITGIPLVLQGSLRWLKLEWRQWRQNRCRRYPGLCSECSSECRDHLPALRPPARLVTEFKMGSKNVFAVLRWEATNEVYESVLSTFLITHTAWFSPFYFIIYSFYFIISRKKIKLGKLPTSWIFIARIESRSQSVIRELVFGYSGQVPRQGP